jgi:hypothetical protein
MAGRAVAIYVYILECADGSYDVGTTRAGLDQRVAEHNAGKYDGYTKGRHRAILALRQAQDEDGRNGAEPHLPRPGPPELVEGRRMKIAQAVAGNVMVDAPQP